MRVVYEAANLIDAYLVRHALEGAGIPAFVRGEALLGGIGELPACGLVAVCVPDLAWPEADALVRTLPLVVGEPRERDRPWPAGAVGA
ncbi:MAG: putative signal transducing protein [Lysobacteraceae bacterium]